MEKRIICDIKAKSQVVEEYEPTQEELDQRAVAQAFQEQEELRELNRITLFEKAKTAITANKKFLADKDMTTAKAITQIQALTRQVNALIRLVVQELDETE